MVRKSFTLSLLATVPAILPLIQAFELQKASITNETVAESSLCLMFEDHFSKFNLAHWKVCEKQLFISNILLCTFTDDQLIGSTK
jgi:hypothetical protein